MFKSAYIISFLAAIVLCLSTLLARAQYFDMDSVKRVTIPFKPARSLVVIQLKINNRGPFNFILDSGVGNMLITEPSLLDSINLVKNRTIKVSGFGQGEDFDASVTQPLKISIPQLVSHNVSAIILKKDYFNLSSYAGVPIYGLLGNELFSHLAVKISFSDSTITIARPKDMKIFRRAAKIPISIENGKPYIKTKVSFNNGTEKLSKLVVDLGAGHFLSMENLEDRFTSTTRSIRSTLGIGIRGEINGSLSRVKEISLGKYKIKNVICALPDEDTRSLSVQRDGNLGLGLLRKFDIIFDYADTVMYLKPGYEMDTPIEQDMTGLTYYAAGPKFDHIIIDKVEPGSAADLIGLEKGDDIASINLKPVSQMSMQQIDDIFRSKDGRILLLSVFRDNHFYRIPIALRRRI